MTGVTSYRTVMTHLSGVMLHSLLALDRLQSINTFYYRHVARGDAGDAQRPLAEFRASLGGSL